MILMKFDLVFHIMCNACILKHASFPLSPLNVGTQFDSLMEKTVCNNKNYYIYRSSYRM